MQEHDGLLVSLLFERLATTLLHFAVVVDCVNRFDTKIIDALKVVLDLEFVHVGRYTEGVVIAGGLAKRVVDENDVLRRHPMYKYNIMICPKQIQTQMFEPQTITAYKCEKDSTMISLKPIGTCARQTNSKNHKEMMRNHKLIVRQKGYRRVGKSHKKMELRGHERTMRWRQSK